MSPGPSKKRKRKNEGSRDEARLDVWFPRPSPHDSRDPCISRVGPAPCVGRRLKDREMLTERVTKGGSQWEERSVSTPKP